MKKLSQFIKESEKIPSPSGKDLTKEKCPKCDGSGDIGNEEFVECPKCGGSGWILKESLSLKQLVEDAQVYHDSDSGSGLEMDPNKSELNDSTKASTEYTFTAPDGSKIEVEIDPKDYHIMGVSSDPGQATKARFELKIALGSRNLQSSKEALVKKGFKISKKDSVHKEFDPPSDEDKWRNH